MHANKNNQPIPAYHQTQHHASTEEKQQAFDQLGQWIKKNAPESHYGDRWTFAPVASEKEGAGVIATAPLEKGQLFMSIPRKVMLSTDILSDLSELGILLSSDMLCMRIPSLYLSMCLLYEREKLNDSFWYPYISCLPQQVSLPLYFDMDHIQQLQASPVLFDLLNLHISTIRQYVHLYTVLKKSGLLGITASSSNSIPFRFTYVSFLWAVSIVMTRQNRVASEKPSTDQSVIALIPAWDMCNHRSTIPHEQQGSNPLEINTYYNVHTKASESYTLSQTKIHDPIYIYYGSRPNAKLFLFAGFIDETHNQDEMNLSMNLYLPTCRYEHSKKGPRSTAAEESYRISLNEQIVTELKKEESKDALYKIKMLLLKKMNVQQPSVTVGLPLAPRPTSQPTNEDEREDQLAYYSILHFCLVAVMNKEEATSALKHKTEPQALQLVPPQSPTHLLRAYEFLLNSLTFAYHMYGTTLQEDVRLLEEAEKSEKKDRYHTLAIQLRISEKKLLTQQIQLVQQWIEETKKETSQ